MGLGRSLDLGRQVIQVRSHHSCCKTHFGHFSRRSELLSTQRWKRNLGWASLVDRVQKAPSREDARSALGLSSDQTTIVLLPASRHQELKYLMPTMFQAAKQIQEKIPNVRFLIPLALEKYRRSIEQAIQQYGLQATLLTDSSKMGIQRIRVNHRFLCRRSQQRI